MNQKFNEPRNKHFYYNETYIDKRGNVLTACGIHVDARREIDLVEPTCEICKRAMDIYEGLRVE